MYQIKAHCFVLICTATSCIMGVEYCFNILGLSTWTENAIVHLAIGIKPLAYRLHQLFTMKYQHDLDYNEHSVDLHKPRKQLYQNTTTYSKMTYSQAILKIHKYGLFVKKPLH